MGRQLIFPGAAGFLGYLLFGTPGALIGAAGGWFASAYIAGSGFPDGSWCQARFEAALQGQNAGCMTFSSCDSGTPGVYQQGYGCP
jgi:hypothetical protein